jgi:hypothetical protein
MRQETQTDFSGGMVDTAADGAAPANSYRYAENFDLADGRLACRPLVGTVKYHTYGLEAVHNDGVFRFSDSTFGDCLFYVAHRPLADDSYDFCGYLLNAEGVYLSSVRIAFPALFGHADGRIYGSETEPLRTPFVFLQVGSAAYAWVMRGAAVYAFRWDGTAEGTPLAGTWQPLSTVYGAGEFGDRLLFSVYAEGAAMLVYSLSAGCWVGVWSGAGMNCIGLVVGDLSTGRELKMLGSDCTLQALSLSESQEFSATSPGRFVSRAFDGGVPERQKLFLRSYTGLVSDATRNDGTEDEPDWQDVPAVADFRSVDTDLAATVTHLTGASMFGAVSKLCVIGRVCRALSLDILFTSGTVRLCSLAVQSQPRGR